MHNGENLSERIARSAGASDRGREVSKRSFGRPPARQLLALVVLAVLGSLALVLVAVRATRDGDDPPATGFSGRQAPFLSNRLPDGVRDKPAPHIRLADARGGTLDTRRLRGTPYVVTFLFTDCPDVCPLIAQELGKALELLGPRAQKVAVAAVTVDPKGDTPQNVRAWLARMRLPHNFHYLIGSEATLKPVWRSYFVGPQRRGVKQSLHTASIWLIDAKGRWRTKFSGGAPVPPADIAHDLRVLIRENEPS